MLALLKALKYSFRVTRILLAEQRYFASITRNEIRDRDEYMPWFTYPAIEALKTWDLSDKRVLEYGSGFSTLFWAKRAKHVLSIEHDANWYKKIANLMPANVDLQLRPLEDYADVEGQFDLIVIDGYAEKRMRYNCAVASLSHLSPGGMVIVDNSDWLPATCLWLRRAGLFQVDLCGFVPQSDHCQATSFFFTPNCAFEHTQCLTPVGGTGYNWEPLLEKELLTEPDPDIVMV